MWLSEGKEMFTPIYFHFKIGISENKLSSLVKKFQKKKKPIQMLVKQE